MHIPAAQLEQIVRDALAEDVGWGDITTLATVPENAHGRARITARAPGMLAGMAVAQEVFRQVDPRIRIQHLAADGAAVLARTPLCELEGPARGILTGERVALNFLQRLSGIASLTARYVRLVYGAPVRVVDTRKTTPGLRLLEKYAVTVGGGHNHRMGLYDAVLIKDNHIVAAGGITAAVRRARERAPHTMTVTVECETLEQVAEALAAGADVLLLDNMPTATLAEAVRWAKGRALTEASGGITEQTVAAIAGTGVDILSVGTLTHSAPALDISLDMLEVTDSTV